MWAQSLSLVLGQIAGAPFSLLLSEVAPERPAEAGSDIFVTVTATGPAQGEMGFRIPQSEAKTLVAIFMQDDAAGEGNDGRAEIEELFRQVAGYVSTSAKATLPNLALAISLSPSFAWPPAAIGWISSAELITSLPLPLLHDFRMAPVHYVEAMRLMHVAFADGIEYSALLAIEQGLECRAQPCIVSSAALDSLLLQLDEARRRADQVFPGAKTDEMTRTCASYAGILPAEDVRLVRCAGFIWARLQAGANSVNLLFSMNQPNAHALAARQHQPAAV